MTNTETLMFPELGDFGTHSRVLFPLSLSVWSPIQNQALVPLLPSSNGKAKATCAKELWTRPKSLPTLKQQSQRQLLPVANVRELSKVARHSAQKQQMMKDYRLSSIPATIHCNNRVLQTETQHDRDARYVALGGTAVFNHITFTYVPKHCANTLVLGFAERCGNRY